MSKTSEEIAIFFIYTHFYLGGKKFINKKTCAEFFISQLIRYKISDKSNLLLICLVLSGLVD